MSWSQITFTVQADKTDLLSECLTNTSALSITLQDAADQPIYEPELNTTPLWQHTKVVALFEAVADIQQICTQVQACLGILPTYEVETLADQAWERAWMNDFQPMRFGEQLWICPSWCELPEPEAVNILFDPGLAFGTGTHPTTALCLEWLAQNVEQFKGKTLIDYGCGSGILAIAAIKLGATHVWAVDNDPQAILATQDNAQKNQVFEQIQACLPNELPTVVVDGLLANILANPLVALADKFCDLLKPQGFLVLSGILSEQAELISTAYLTYFEQLNIEQQEQWLRIVSYKCT